MTLGVVAEELSEILPEGMLQQISVAPEQLYPLRIVPSI
jgi:hypothetical protein